MILDNNQGTTPRPCEDHCGTLPPCAPLAVPYVPFQQTGSELYSHTQALENGTLFPGLNLPFRVKTVSASPAGRAAAELQALEFVITELGLYLDTHQSDAEAFALYQQYEKLAREGRARYTAMYGPLYQTDTVKDSSYTWLNDPWPWEYPGTNGADRGRN